MNTRKNGTISRLRYEFQYGMHACGSIYDLMFTNSLESLTYWYSQGIRLFEIDIDYAGNDEFVACHNFTRETFEKMEIDDIPEKCTAEWFQQQKLYKKSTAGLTPMTLKDVFAQMQKRADMLVMIDPKVYSHQETIVLLDKIKQMELEFGINKERIVFELYNKDMISAANCFPNTAQFQYCVDDEMEMGSSREMGDWDINCLIDYLNKNNIWILSYPWKLAVENLAVLRKFYEAGFVVFSKTRNDIFSELLRQAGVRINLIDHLVTQQQREELQSYKKDYYKKYKAKIDNVFGSIV